MDPTIERSMLVRRVSDARVIRDSEPEGKRESRMPRSQKLDDALNATRPRGVGGRRQCDAAPIAEGEYHLASVAARLQTVSCAVIDVEHRTARARASRDLRRTGSL